MAHEQSKYDVRHARGLISLPANDFSDNIMELIVQGEGNVLSLLTMQSRSGRAAMLRDSATSETSPVQLNQPAACLASQEGAKSFATGAWLQPAKLTRAAGLPIS